MKYYNQKELGKRIQKLRKKAGMKQIDLAEELYISNDMLSRIENGKSTCAPDYLVYLCQRFNKTTDYFYFGDEYENNSKTRLEMIDEVKEMLQGAERKRVWEIYRIVQILIKI